MDPAEIARLGEEIYQHILRPLVEPAHNGEFLVLDVASGVYEIADDDFQATRRLLARVPGAIPYGVRIGHRTAYRIGGSRR